jgi:hypothetical protein
MLSETLQPGSKRHVKRGKRNQGISCSTPRAIPRRQAKMQRWLATWAHLVQTESRKGRRLKHCRHGRMCFQTPASLSPKVSNTEKQSLGARQRNKHRTNNTNTRIQANTVENCGTQAPRRKPGTKCSRGNRSRFLSPSAPNQINDALSASCSTFTAADQPVPSASHSTEQARNDVMTTRELEKHGNSVKH